MEQVEIAHVRDGEGFTDNWYDKVDDDETLADYFITLPSEIEGDLYVTVETYFPDVVPEECVGGETLESGEKTYEIVPVVYFGVYILNDDETQYEVYATQYYSDQGHFPILVPNNVLKPNKDILIDV
jgi:hypothetical protein